MSDLFEREQRVYDRAVNRINEIRNGGAACSLEELDTLTQEYGKLLKQLRRVTKIFDRTTIDLNTSKLDLIGKVYYDALTGLYNRRFMDEGLSQCIKTLSQSGGALSVLMADIDFFKQYNDTYGHDAGDRCLEMIAKTLQSCLSRTGDFAARYGGEEFAVILPHTDERGAKIVAQRLLDRVRDLKIPHEENPPVGYVTISLGVTCAKAGPSQNGSAYIKRADEALYLSKRGGRNQYRFLGLTEEK